MSGLIPQPFIDELLHRTDVVEFIDAYVPLKKRGTSHTACCPFHSEKSPSFNVIPKKQFYHCFGCGASGNVISFTMNYLNQSFPEAIETLATRLGLTVPREGNYEKNNTASHDLYKLLAKISNYYQNRLKNEGKAAIDYLRSRGLSGKIAKQYQLGFAPEGWHHLEQTFATQKEALITTGMLVQNEDGKIYDRYRNRIMFPIHDRHGRIIGFGGRVLDASQKPKYLNSPETVLFQKSRELYGLHQILSQKKHIDSIILVEGYMDVIALAQHGISNAVATLGTATSTYHIQLLAKQCKHLLFCFDGDAAGQHAAWRALESSLAHLNSGLDARFIFLPKDQDPDSLIRAEGKEDFLKRLHDALPLDRFFFNTLAKEIHLLTPAGRTQLIHKAKPLLEKMSEGSYKQLLINDLARLTHIDTHRLNQLLTDSSRMHQQEQTSVARSPIRIAIALLLQNPELYSQTAEHLNPSLLDEQEHALLLDLFKQLAKKPESTTATLLETWRHQKAFESISQLATWDHQVPEQELIKEFIDIMLFLQKQNRDHIIRVLIDKARQKGLNEEEKQRLQKMLQERHTTD